MLRHRRNLPIQKQEPEQVGQENKEIIPKQIIAGVVPYIELQKTIYLAGMLVNEDGVSKCKLITTNWKLIDSDFNFDNPRVTYEPNLYKTAMRAYRVRIDNHAAILYKKCQEPDFNTCKSMISQESTIPVWIYEMPSQSTASLLTVCQQ